MTIPADGPAVHPSQSRGLLAAHLGSEAAAEAARRRIARDRERDALRYRAAAGRADPPVPLQPAASAELDRLRADLQRVAADVVGLRAEMLGTIDALRVEIAEDLPCIIHRMAARSTNGTT
jgi:hypothetical protein